MLLVGDFAMDVQGEKSVGGMIPEDLAMRFTASVPRPMKVKHAIACLVKIWLQVDPEQRKHMVDVPESEILNDLCQFVQARKSVGQGLSEGRKAHRKHKTAVSGAKSG